MDSARLWKRYQKHLVKCSTLGITLDCSRMSFPSGYHNSMADAMDKAYEAMTSLESGAIANPDENRMVGHYWLRTPHLAPDESLREAIIQTHDDIKAFANAIHRKQIVPPKGRRFSDVLVIGIGGSALGPQLVADALGTSRDKMRIHFMDNTDPDGIHRVLEQIGNALKSTLVVVISKSGGTPETRNGMLFTKQAFDERKLDFSKQAVAITGEGSHLDKTASSEGWLKRFPMWDWVGGRTSVTSAVGLLPMALQGINVDKLLKGASRMDALTRSSRTNRNPAAQLALMWYFATGGKGEKEMVILPYKDRLVLFSRYLQQLVMESLGKELDLDGNVVNQGIVVFGNKGSTDQHAYVQQLRDGLDNFFATFLVVLQDTPKVGKLEDVEVDSGVTGGDYLSGFWQGTRQALYEKGRGSMTITCEKLDAQTLGALIALYERAVGFYGTLVNVNAYHQPGVEAGKKAAAKVIDLQKRVVDAIAQVGSEPFDAIDVAEKMGAVDQVETVYHILEHLAANNRGITRQRTRYQTL